MTDNSLNNDNIKLANLLFPDVKDYSYYEEKYPRRNLKEGAKVTRFAPSPTGFLHIGGLFASLASYILAKESNGIFMLRIEDTDKKREIEDGVSAIVDGLAQFGICPDEGVVGFNNESGEYGPYIQSQRKEIYQSYAKKFVEDGNAYPCFCDEEELNSVREIQESKKIRTGYYGEWTKCRNLSFDVIQDNIKAGKPYVLRLKSPGKEENRIKIEDCIRGKVEMPENDQDIVILKRDGIPTYHFAHMVDDHLMGTTHVLRGDEWLISTPIHLQLFYLAGFKAPKYVHIAPIMKEDNGGKRKISKRKDPEAAVSYFYESGYPKEAVIEYLLTIANSNFEDWRRANKLASPWEFPFTLKKMSKSGALFDFAKFNDVSRNVIGKMSAEKVYEYFLAYVKEFDPDFTNLVADNKEKLTEMFNIDRNPNKPRKDIEKWSDVKDWLSYMFDETWNRQREYPENIAKEDVRAILEKYLTVYDEEEDNQSWFETVKSICSDLGFCPDVKAYKADPDSYKGHVGDVSTVIRVAVTGRTNTPNLCKIMQLLGEGKIVARIKEAIESIK